MQEWLRIATEYSVLLIDFMALAIIVHGSVEAFLKVVFYQLWTTDGDRRREIWLRYARWLVAGLTFQLAADIIETSITPDWQAIARIAAIAVIRTFLNYFLEKDIDEVRDIQREKRLQIDRPSSL